MLVSIIDYVMQLKKTVSPLSLYCPARMNCDRGLLRKIILDFAFQLRVFDDDDGRRIVFQVWDWSNDGRFYTLNHFIMKQRAGEWKTTHLVTKYRALQRQELSEILRAAGFSEIHRHMPAESGFYQPLVTARKI